MKMKKEILVFIFLLVSLSACDFFGLKSATDDGKKSLVSTPISVKDNNLFENLKNLVDKIDVGFDTLKFISSSTITGMSIQEFTLWKSSGPLVKVEVLPKNNKSLVSINIHNYPAYPSRAYINETRMTFEDGKLVGKSIVVIVPDKQPGISLGMVVAIGIVLIVVFCLFMLTRADTKKILQRQRRDYE